MSGARDTSRIALVLLDIEGTTTPMTFVTEVLFPYARRHLRAHLEAHGSDPAYSAIVGGLRAEHVSAEQTGDAPPRWDDETAAATRASAIAFVEWLMDHDRKSAPLKELQGRIWQDGYERGEIAGDVFPDVPAALRRWNSQGVQVGIFSSGSVLAQQLLFRHSSAGDLTSLLQWYFDTHVGAKGDPESYRRIAQTVGVRAESALFLSDVGRELDAALAGGMQARLVMRPGNAPVESAVRYGIVRTFAEVTPRPADSG